MKKKVKIVYVYVKEAAAAAHITVIASVIMVNCFTVENQVNSFLLFLHIYEYNINFTTIFEQSKKIYNNNTKIRVWVL